MFATALTSTRSVISSRFTTLLQRIEPTLNDEVAFDAHRQSVKTRLETVLATHQVRPIGSSQRQSAIRNSSDLDLLSVLKKDELTWGQSTVSSDTALLKVKNALSGRFPFSEVGRDGQAVVVAFDGGRRPVDVVPALFAGLHPIHRKPLYWIPNGNGGWLQTSPEAHNQYIHDANISSGYKLRNVAKLLKFWRKCRIPETPLSSFHVEMLLALSGTCNGLKGYSTCLFQAFQLLASRNCAAIQDPLGISSYIQAAHTASKRSQLISRVNTSAVHAARALVFERAGKTADAVNQWDIVFNGDFPK